MNGMSNLQSIQTTDSSSVAKYLINSNQPVVLEVKQKGKYKKLGIILPYSTELEKQATESLGIMLKEGKSIKYEAYKERMMTTAYEQLQEGKIKVKPGDVIAAENLEETKKKNKMLGHMLLNDAVAHWANRSSWHFCPNCGHMMRPEAMRGMDSSEEGEIINDEITQSAP